MRINEGVPDTSRNNLKPENLLCRMSSSKELLGLKVTWLF
jgi:hypothetical protein